MRSCMQFSIAPSRWLRSGWPTHLGVESRHCGKNTALPSDCSLPLVWFNGLYSWSCAASVPTKFQAMISWLWGMIAFLKKHKAFATLVMQRSRYMWRHLFPSRWKVAVMWQSCLIAWWRARHRHRWQPKPVTSSSAMSFQRRAPNSLQMWRPPDVCKPSCAPWMHTCPARKCRNKLCGAWRIWDWTDQKMKRDWWRWEVPRPILRAMAEHCSNEAVQKEGCVALAKLTTEHQNILRFLSLGADQVILDALRNYTTSTGVQWWAFQALGNLAESREGRAKLREHLTADVINTAMSSGNSEIQEKGQLLLDKLGPVGHTGSWDVTLFCCAEASPVCQDRRTLGGWLRWLSRKPAARLGEVIFANRVS